MGYVLSIPEPEVLSTLSSVVHPCDCCEDFQECLQRSPASPWIVSRTRRAIDIAVALAVLIASSVPMLIVAAVIRLTSSGPAIFSQLRVGMKGRLFRIYKFRSMTEKREQHGPGLTRAGDNRVTAVGRLMRKFKIDELPQFYNVLRGDMSLVGPRPKLPQYSSMNNMNYRPGITGVATIIFRHEEEMMSSIAPHELDDFYAEKIMPVKAQLDVCYMCKATAGTDLRIVTETVLICIRPLVPPPVQHPAPVAKARVASYRVAQEEGAATNDR